MPVAVAWWVGTWPPNVLVVGFVVYTDAAIIYVMTATESHVVALPAGILLCLVAVFAAVGGSGRLLAGHLAVSVTALVVLAVLAVTRGDDAWLVSSRTAMLLMVFGVPVVLYSYIGRLRQRATEALLDSLTGLWNRRGLFDALDARNATQTEGEAESVVGVVVIDIDRFKVLNERFGRDSGDDILCEVARRLSRASSPGSVVARLGGDEFVCVHCGSLAAVDAAEERIRAALQDPFTGPPFTASVGSVTDALIDEHNPAGVVQRLLALADIELYRTKRRATGFDVTEFDTPTAGLPAVRERVAALIASGGPTIVFQPVISTASGDTVGYEALSRFPSGSGSPMVWFRDATVAGVACDLELAAIDNALKAMAVLPTGAFVSLNTSAETIRTADLLPRLEPHLSTRTMYLELTEHQRVDDFGAITYVIDELRSAGVRLAVDDIGAGFASLLPIIELRPDLLKTDNSLTHGIDTDPVRRAAAAAMVTFAHEIGALILMEGVETVAEHRVVVEIGADLAQGFLHGRPAEAEAAAAR
ncbi:MAG: bifunctional diguanylate cyclase/phosphodiesterase [Mycobacterium sp.]